MSTENSIPSIEDMLLRHDMLRAILDQSGDCIKVLNMEGKLQYMNLGGRKVMEVDDFSVVAECPWIGFWEGPHFEQAQKAIGAAKAGGVGHFQGECPTAKGKVKWWDVQVSSFTGENQKKYLLSISRDITPTKNAEEQMKLVMGELQHRIKNMYTIVQSVAANTLRNASSVEEAGTKLDERLVALGRSHSLLTTEGKAADITQVIESAITPCSQETKKRVTMNGPPIQLGPKPALALGMAMHELCTNAIKYGALSNDCGDIKINWDIVEDINGKHLKLHWAENGGPAVNKPSRKGFGSLLIQRSLAAQVEGDVDLDFATAGVNFSFKAPLANLEASITLN